MASTINASTSAGIIQTADTSGVLALQTGGTTGLTLNPTGSVAFGTSATAYGTSGQVLTSTGNSTPNWATPAPGITLADVYPVGSIYMNTSNSANPSALFGFGTWAVLSSGRVLVGNGGAFTAGATGGSADAVVVDHTHTYSSTSGGQSVDHSHTYSATSGAQSADHTHTYSGSTGGMSANADHSHTFTIKDRNINSPPYMPLHAAGSPWATGTTSSANLAHTHSFSGTTAGMSVSHTHAVSGTTAGVSVGHTHAISGTTSSASGGASGTNANLQPYLVVYMWQRTA